MSPKVNGNWFRSLLDCKHILLFFFGFRSCFKLDLFRLQGVIYLSFVHNNL